ncbi:MAG: 7-cyano-7-deazaguanine synthase [Candidatus Hodarchaeales archaeon]
MESVVILLSGGIDSSVALYEIIDNKEYKIVSGVFFNYGQVNQREEDAAKAISEKADVSLETIALPTDLDRLKLPSVSNPPKSSKIWQQDNYMLPSRNLVFLGVASQIAWSYNARYLVFGASGVLLEDDIYPDCAPDFIHAAKTALQLSGVIDDILAPNSGIPKSKVLEKAYQLEVPLELTYSCYHGDNKGCGVCPACVSRIKAFKLIDKEDPQEYR